MILHIHLYSTLFMTGVIWIIQRVHYPSFLYVSEDNFKNFETFHIKRITPIVAITMLIELTTATFLVTRHHNLLYINFICLVFIWMSTFIFSVPLHKQLTNQYSIKLINKLILTNWPRTILWSIRSILLIILLQNQ